jgi:hypothetical protein
MGGRDVTQYCGESIFERGDHTGKFENSLDTSFGMPSVYITGPDGFVALSNDHVIQRGDFLAIDWGVGYLNFYTDMKRHAYVLQDSTMAAPCATY